MSETKNDQAGAASPGADESHRGEMSEAAIDRTLAETFPASDPPSWTLGIDQRAPPAHEPNDKTEGPE